MDPAIPTDGTFWQNVGAFFGGIAALWGGNRVRRHVAEGRDRERAREPADRIVAAIEETSKRNREDTKTIAEAIRDEGRQTRTQLHGRLTQTDGKVDQVGRDLAELKGKVG